MDNRDIFGRIIPRKDSAINIEAEESRIEELKELAKHDPLKDEIAKRMGDLIVQGIDKQMIRENRLLSLMYLFQAVADDIPLSQALMTYGWSKQDVEPKVSFHKPGRFLLIKDMSFGETHFFLHKRTEPLEQEVDTNKIKIDCLTLIHEMMEKV